MIQNVSLKMSEKEKKKKLYKIILKYGRKLKF